MAKSKRNRRSQNTVGGAAPEIVNDDDGSSETALVIQQPGANRLVRTQLFSAELEEAIDLIAKERVYRAMVARLGLRLLAGPRINDNEPAP